MEDLHAQLAGCRNFYRSGVTRPYAYRLAQLKRLRKSLLDHEQEIYKALFSDLKKGKEEVWVTETGFTLTELNHTIRNLGKWMKPVRKTTNLLNLPSRCRVYREPLGTVLIISPWNYPLQLLLTPLVGAIAAGNTVVLKPSEFAPATSTVMRSIIHTAFSPEEVLYVEGDGASVIPRMLDHFVFDHIFYTGSTAVGKIIYQAAAKNLVPVTLELGGKSPCVVEEDADIRVAARRIMMTKFSNAGQMCVAPDYVLVHHSKKDAFVEACKQALLQFFGSDPAASNEYGRIINHRQFDRLAGYLAEGVVLAGGQTDREQLYIAPTLLADLEPGAKLMEEEIFGPLLPVIPFSERSEAAAIIDRHPDPLAFYVFTSSSLNEKYWIEKLPFGGGCVNNAALHLTNQRLPFGGRGASGIGRYHGPYSFQAFTHEKAVMKTPTWFDPAMKYPPFAGKLDLFRRLIR